MERRTGSGPASPRTASRSSMRTSPSRSHRATQRLGPETTLRVVDAIISGTHRPGTSHYELLRAFACDAVLACADRVLERQHYRTHEFGDSVWIERAAERVQPRSNLKTATLA